MWSREVFYDRLIAYNNEQWEEFKGNDDVRDAVSGIMKQRAEEGNTDPVDFKINSVKDLRKKDKHGGPPRFAQLFSYSRDQLSKHAGLEKEALRTKVYLPPIKTSVVKPEVDFNDLYLNLLKG